MKNAGLEEAQAGIKIARTNISNFRYADDTTLMAESEEELKSFLMKVKEESEKVGSKINPGKAGISGLHSRLPRGVRPRLEGKPRTPLSSRVATRISWCPLSGLKGFQPPLHF